MYILIVIRALDLRHLFRLVVAAKHEKMRVSAVGSVMTFSNLYPEEEQILLETSQMRTREDGPPIELDTTDVIV